MIPSTRDIVYGLFGAWRLAHLDRGGMAYFDVSDSGFWKSFFAAVLVAPIYIVFVALDMSEQVYDVGLLRVFLIHLLTYSMSWTVFPVIVHPICQAIDRDKSYVPYIVALNWAMAIQFLIYLPVAIILWLEILPSALAVILKLGTYAVLLGYEWFIARTALNVQPWPATGLVALNFMIGIILTTLVIALLH